MPQLHCYVPDELARKLQEKARESKLSVSKYLALLIEKQIENQWPKNYFKLFGGWQGETLERPVQRGYEQRATID